MAKKRSELEEELMTPANIERVIALLEPKDDNAKKATKKDACQILGMAYNVTRLATIIQAYKDKVAKEKERRAALRGKPVTMDEVSFIVSEYLEGAPIDSISTSTFRSTHSIKKVLEDYAVPIRAASHDYFNPEFIPDGAVKSRFDIGEIAYSTRYDSKVLVEKEQIDPKHLGYIYRVWLLSERWLQYAYCEAFELASLQHLKDKGIKL